MRSVNQLIGDRPETIAADGDEVRIGPSPDEIADALVMTLIRDARAARAALHVAVAEIAERDAQIKRLRAQNESLREEIRRYVARQVGMEHAA